MSDTGSDPRGYRFVYDPMTQPELFDGILSKRIVAFIIDAVLIVMLMIPAALMIFILGIVTLGIAWLLFPALFAIVALGYCALTLGGRASATPGMRVCRRRDAHVERPEDVRPPRRHACPHLLVLGRHADAVDPARRAVHPAPPAPP